MLLSGDGVPVVTASSYLKQRGWDGMGEYKRDNAAEEEGEEEDMVLEEERWLIRRYGSLRMEWVFLEIRARPFFPFGVLVWVLKIDP